MKRIAVAVVAALGLTVASGAALAQHTSGGGGHMSGSTGGGYHGGGYHGGGYYHGSHFTFGVGFPYWGFGYGYPYYAGYPYYPYYSYPYYGAYYSGYPAYTDGPVYDDPAPGAYIQRDMNSGPQGSQAAPGNQSQYSYYCPSPAGYYPQVQTCAKGWLKVVPENSPQPPQ